MTQEGLELLKALEGCRLTAYRCPAGVWTIGYGHTKGVTDGMTITADRAEELLLEDVQTFRNAVKRAVKVEQTEQQIDALTILAYNIGVRAFRDSSLLRCINQGKPRQMITAQWQRWHYVGKTESVGLLNRRNEEIALYYGE